MNYAERMSRKSPLISSMCGNYGHKNCHGWRGKGRRHVCQCYCHAHICPRCKQPTAAATRKGLLEAAAQLEALAKSVRIKALGVNA